MLSVRARSVVDMGALLVVGATGTVGRRVATHLTEAGIGFRSRSRSAVPAFDWAQPDTWGPALEGVDGVFLLLPEGVGLDPAFLDLVSELRVVLLSSQGIDEMDDQRLLSAERAVQAAVPDHAIVRADGFDQNFSEGFLRDAVLAGQLVMPVGDVKQTFVDVRDIAAVAVALLTTQRDVTGTVEVTGPEALAFDEVAGILSEVTGSGVGFDGSADAYRELMAGFGAPSPRSSGAETLHPPRPWPTSPVVRARPSVTLRPGPAPRAPGSRPECGHMLP